MAQTYTLIADGVRTVFQIPVAVQAVSDITAVLVNGSAGPAVSSVAGETVTLASAPAVGTIVAISYKDRRMDHYPDFIETKDRPILVSYTPATHTLVGTGIPGNIVDAYAGPTYLVSTLVAADGGFTVVVPTFSGTQLITATQRRPDLIHPMSAISDAFGVSSIY